MQAGMPAGRVSSAARSGRSSPWQVEVPSKEKCKDEARELTATIERGVADGHRVVFERASEQRPGEIPGNVEVVLAAAPHLVFRREGSDLEMTLRISLKEASCT